MRIHVASALFAALSLVAGQLEYHPLSGELELVKLPSHKAHKIHTVHSRAAATAHFDADAQEKQIIADFEHDFSAVLKRRQVPGMMYTVVRQNKTIAASGLGVADMNNPDSKVDGDTLFMIGHTEIVGHLFLLISVSGGSVNGARIFVECGGMDALQHMLKVVNL
ncbi:hypothetical protein GQ42DRAFT_152261 [Ramicandelaber brevisporus]|nr:hypothetical protein GQ42DRAFT_152261 [Ramicandelaber brevisporus]